MRLFSLFLLYFLVAFMFVDFFAGLFAAVRQEVSDKGKVGFQPLQAQVLYRPGRDFAGGNKQIFYRFVKKKAGNAWYVTKKLYLCTVNSEGLT